MAGYTTSSADRSIEPRKHRDNHGFHDRAVEEKHIGDVFIELDLPPSDTHRRVPAVLRLQG
ncbi:hypothetical protein [Nocardia gamkensis]|uniref:hypothetical protein n=1 Tax=Nocardia gamkensis TaxID=352869 RepID=UPI0007A3D1FB|nr:hypothetical protein [Nocardia gamkensis]NQE65917.1 hypothetical protein [Nocardia gamkensis]